MKRDHLDMIVRQNVRRRKASPMARRRFWFYLASLLTAALMCAMAWLIANYHPERQVSEAVLVTTLQPTKGAPAQTKAEPSVQPPASGASPIVLSVYDSTLFHGKTMANGDSYDHFRNTAATGDDVPLGTVLLCKWQSREVEVVVTDRINRRFYGKRIDLSGGAMLELYPGYDLTDSTATILKGATFEVIK